MKKLIFSIILLFAGIFAYSQTAVVRPRVDADLLNGQSSTFYLNTSSTAQTKSGNITFGGGIYLGSDSTYIIQNADSVLFIVDSDTVAIMAHTSTDPQLIIDPNRHSSVARPGLAFGDGNTGFYESTDNNLYVSLEGTNKFQFKSDQFRSNDNNSFRLALIIPTGTNPSIIPMSNDYDTGIGHYGGYAADNLSLIAGAVEGIRIAEGGGKIKVTITDTLQVDGLLVASGTISGKTSLTLDTDATITLATADCRNAVRFNNDADVIDYTLPGAAAGLVVMFYDIGGGVITVDPVDATDTIYLNGTSVGAGDAIDSPGAVGDFICLMAIDATRWVTVGRSGVWIDSGP